MILITDLSKIDKKFSGSIITLGNFDGLHLGHQELIRKIILRAEETGGLSMIDYLQTPSAEDPGA
jgi:riboflavin kinase/FMN adenylyltransferase